MIALVLSLLSFLPLTNMEARQSARDTAPFVLPHPTAVRVGHCLLRGGWGRCPVVVRSRKGHCRYRVEIHKRQQGLLVRVVRLECWSR